jgi:oligoendopeptidase F
MNPRLLRHAIGAACALLLTHGALAAGPAKPSTLVRAEIPAQYRWDFAPIYPSWDAWEADMAKTDALVTAFAGIKGTLKNGPAAVLKAYQAFDEIGKLQYKLYGYTSLQRDVDTRNADISGKYQCVNALGARLSSATAWFMPELLKVPQPTMEKWLRTTPALAPYKFTIMDSYRQQKHVLDEKGEQLLSYAELANQNPTATFQELSTSDIKFPKITLASGKEVTLTPGAYQSILQTNVNQADRAKAFAAFLANYGANANTYGAIYNGILQRDWFLARARNFPTTLDAAVDGKAVPPAVVRTLIDTTRKGTAPVQRYMKLRKKLLGLDTYHLYDGSLPVFNTDTTSPYDDAKELVLSSVAPLGAEYVAKYKQFLSGKQIDVYENEGKRPGAYVSGIYGVGPYMLLNHNDTQNALFTLAHEGGHAMHSILSFENQPFATADYTIFVAEVASTSNERLLLNKLLASTSDPKERFLLLQNAVDAIVGTFYAQVLFADFELQAHELVEQGKPITAEVLNGIYLKLIKDYYGDAVVVDDLYKYTWTRIPHFYNSPYYVFQYATCFASSAKLVKDMTTGDAAARAGATARYLELLKSGGNDHPMTQLKKAGVDLSQRATVQAVIDQMDLLVGQMETEAAKIR